MIPATFPGIVENGSHGRSVGHAAREAWRLFWRIFMEDKRRRWAILSELGISPQQSMALGTLKPGEPMPMSALADALHCDNSNITGIVDRLEAAGLAERRPSRARPAREGRRAHREGRVDADRDRAPRRRAAADARDAVRRRTRPRCATSWPARWARTEHPVGRIAQAAITFRLSFDMDRRARVLRTPRRRDVSPRRRARVRGSPSGVGSRQVSTGGGAVLVRANAVNAHPRRLAAAFAIVVALVAPRRAGARPRRRPPQLRPRRPHRRHLPGEPQLRQPLRPLGGRPRSARRGPGAHPPDQPTGHALHLPAAERRQPHVAAPLGPVRPTPRRRRRSPATSSTSRS